MNAYKEMVALIMSRGMELPDRTGTGTLALFGYQMRFDLNEGFPLVTLKQTNWRGAFVEMLWIIRGYSTLKFLHQNGCHIWDEWADKDGHLGPIYGAQWRNSGEADGVDQLANLLESLRVDPFSRRHIIDSWSPGHLPVPGYPPSHQPAFGRMSLAPCHCLVQFHVDDQQRLHCQLYQRSADVFLGVPFNIAGYSLLTHMLAKHLGYGVGEFIWDGGNVHLYKNHYDQAIKMLRREPTPNPELNLRYPDERPLWEVDISEIGVTGYHPHPYIPAEVSV